MKFVSLCDCFLLHALLAWAQTISICFFNIFNIGERYYSGGHRILARVRKVGFQKMLTRFPRFLVSDFPDFCPPIFPIFVFRFPKYLFSFFSFLFRVGRNFNNESESFNRNLVFKEKMCYDEYYVVNGELDSDPI